MPSGKIESLSEVDNLKAAEYPFIPSFDKVIRDVERFFSVFNSPKEAGICLLKRLSKDLEVNGMPFGIPITYTLEVSPEFFSPDSNVKVEAMLYSNLTQGGYPVKRVEVNKDLTLPGYLLVEFLFGSTE